MSTEKHTLLSGFPIRVYSRICPAYPSAVQILYLLEAERIPLRCKSKEGSLKSTSKISNVPFVLKEASSCWADVPRQKRSKEEAAYEQQNKHEIGGYKWLESGEEERQHRTGYTPFQMVTTKKNEVPSLKP